MTRLDRLILMEIIGPFVGSAFLFTGLFFAGGDLIRFASYLQGGAGAWMVAQMIFFRFPMFIALTFPMAILLGTLLSFGRLSGDSELIALVAAGISFERVVAPVAVFGLAVSLVGLWFNESVVPDATRRGEALVTAYKARGGAPAARW
jgi:lipopolysaccharide export system permease protein